MRKPVTQPILPDAPVVAGGANDNHPEPPPVSPPQAARPAQWTFTEALATDSLRPRGAGVYEFALSQGEREALGSRLLPLSGTMLSEDPACFIVAAQAALRESLAPHRLNWLQQMRTGAIEPAAVMLSNLPVDPVVRGAPRPGEDIRALKPTCVSEAVLTSISAEVGAGYGLDVEGDELIANVTPDPAHVAALTGLGSTLPLDCHVEHAAARGQNGLDRAPDFLALAGVVAPRQGPQTIVADARAALRRVDPWVEGVLRQDRFVRMLPQRWRGVLGGAEGHIGPVMTGPVAAPSFSLAFYGGLVQPQDDIAAKALRLMEAAVQEVAVPVVVGPGTALLIGNHVALHGRTGFDADFSADGRPNRWLQRIFIALTRRRFADWPSRDGHLFVVDRL